MDIVEELKLLNFQFGEYILSLSRDKEYPAIFTKFLKKIGKNNKKKENYYCTYKLILVSLFIKNLSSIDNVDKSLVYYMIANFLKKDNDKYLDCDYIINQLNYCVKLCFGLSLLYSNIKKQI